MEHAFDSLHIGVKLCKSCEVERSIEGYKIGKRCAYAAIFVSDCVWCALKKPLDGSKMKRCRNCHITRYCSEKCNEDDHQFHKLWCKELVKLKVQLWQMVKEQKKEPLIDPY